jgi:hypothetical protein
MSRRTRRRIRRRTHRNKTRRIRRNTIFTKPINLKQESIVLSNNQTGNIIPGLRNYLKHKMV